METLKTREVNDVDFCYEIYHVTRTNAIAAIYRLGSKEVELKYTQLFAAAPDTAKERDELKTLNAELLEALKKAKQEILAAYRLLDMDNPERGRGVDGVLTKIDNAISKSI